MKEKRLRFEIIRKQADPLLIYRTAFNMLRLPLSPVITGSNIVLSILGAEPASAGSALALAFYAHGSRL